MIAGPEAAGRQSFLAVDVRLATAADKPAVLDFAARTWDGWDYIPEVWDEWLASADGIMLVATPRDRGPGAGLELDLYGRSLEPGRPIGLCRVRMLSEDEAWMEGLRVAPGVRRRGVGTALTAAALRWGLAQGATVARYATGARNEGSHRLATAFGFATLAGWRTYAEPEQGDVDDAGAAESAAFTGASDDSDAEPGVAPDRDVTPDEMDARGALDGPSPDEPIELADEAALHRALAATEDAERAARERAVGDALAGRGLRVAAGTPDDVIGRWWSLVDHDPTFAAGDRLYEGRPWTFQRLSRERLAAHVRAGEVLAIDEPGATDRSGAAREWALMILPARRPWEDDDDPPSASLLAGTASAALRLSETVQDVAGGLRVRLPDPDPPVLRGWAARFADAGLVAHPEALHVFELPLGATDAVEAALPAGALRYADPPVKRAVATPIP